METLCTLHKPILDYPGNEENNNLSSSCYEKTNSHRLYKVNRKYRRKLF
jgi:hypothetical protein